MGNAEEIMLAAPSEGIGVQAYRSLGAFFAALSLGLLLQRALSIQPSPILSDLIAYYRKWLSVLVGWIQPVLEPVLRLLENIFEFGPLEIYLRPRLGDTSVINSVVVPSTQDTLLLLLILFGALSRGLSTRVAGSAFLALWGAFVAITAIAVHDNSPNLVRPAFDTKVPTYLWKVMEYHFTLMSPVLYLSGALVFSFVRGLQIDRSRIALVLVPAFAAAIPVALLAQPANRYVADLLSVGLIWYWIPVLTSVLLVLLTAILALEGVALAAWSGLQASSASFWTSWRKTIPVRIALDLLSIVLGALLFLAANAGLDTIDFQTG